MSGHPKWTAGGNPWFGEATGAVRLFWDTITESDTEWQTGLPIAWNSHFGGSDLGQLPTAIDDRLNALAHRVERCEPWSQDTLVQDAYQLLCYASQMQTCWLRWVSEATGTTPDESACLAGWAIAIWALRRQSFPLCETREHSPPHGDPRERAQSKWLEKCISLDAATELSGWEYILANPPTESNVQELSHYPQHHTALLLGQNLKKTIIKFDSGRRAPLRGPRLDLRRKAQHLIVPAVAVEGFTIAPLKPLSNRGGAGGNACVFSPKGEHAHVAWRGGQREPYANQMAPSSPGFLGDWAVGCLESVTTDTDLKQVLAVIVPLLVGAP